jgi:hypothetical protein
VVLSQQLDAGDLDLQYLQAELARIDHKVQRLSRRWQLAGQDPTDAFRGLYMTDEQAQGLLAQPFAGNWGLLAPLPQAEREAFDRADAVASARVAEIAAQAEREGHVLRLRRLAKTFALSPFEFDALLVCLAPSLDLRYERLYGYLQDDVTRRHPTVNLLLDLLAEPGAGRLVHLASFGDEGALFEGRLVDRVRAPTEAKPSPLTETLRPDPTVLTWLLGHYRPHPDLGPHAGLAEPGDTTSDRLLVGEQVAGDIEGWAAARARTDLPILALFGPDRASQASATHLCAASLGLPLVPVDLADIVAHDGSPHEALHLCLRDARLVGAIACIRGWDALLDDGGSPPRRVFDDLCAFPGPVIVVSAQLWHPSGTERQRAVHWIAFPVPDYARRLSLWSHFLDLSDPDPSLRLSALAGQFALMAGQIADAVASAQDTAAQAHRPLQADDLFAAARAYSNPGLAALARKIVPRYTWSDIILPADQLTLLHEIVDTVRGRPLVLDEWGLGRKLASSSGVTVLFAGPPGTGKTMAAEVIAGELGLDLFKIDLSTVISKYIGETEKNLERIFEEAQTSNAILFFDEADAIFGKRSEVRDAHDRYANIEISYLLQRMEIYDGVAILATNLRANLDEAFTRRLQFSVHFPFPEEEYRERIWRTLFPPDVPRSADIDFGLLARRFRISGGNIRNIIVSAAYLAGADGREVCLEHLLHGARREMQKMGRLVSEADLALPAPSRLST